MAHDGIKNYKLSKSSFLQAWFSLKLCEHLVPMLSCRVSIPYKPTFKFKLKKRITENVVLCFQLFESLHQFSDENIGLSQHFRHNVRLSLTLLIACGLGCCSVFVLSHTEKQRKQNKIKQTSNSIASSQRCNFSFRFKLRSRLTCQALLYSQEDLDEAVKRETEALRKQVRTLKVPPPVHTILSRKRGFSKTLFKPKGI